MNRAELLDSFTSSLQEMYDTEVFDSAIEFCQGESRVLFYLHMHDEAEIYPSDISDSLYVTRQRITSILSSLRKKGYVYMEMAKNDRRKMRVTLTDNGRSHIVAKEAEMKNYFGSLIDVLGEKNIQEMTRLIKLTNDQFKQIKK